MTRDAVTDAIRQLEGKTLYTLFRPSPFDVVDVGDKTVRIQTGKRKLRSILINRIAKIAGLPTSRDELRRVTLQEFPDSRNTSYIAAIVDAINKPVAAR